HPPTPGTVLYRRAAERKMGMLVRRLVVKISIVVRRGRILTSFLGVELTQPRPQGLDLLDTQLHGRLLLGSCGPGHTTLVKGVQDPTEPVRFLKLAVGHPAQHLPAQLVLPDFAEHLS